MENEFVRRDFTILVERSVAVVLVLEGRGIVDGAVDLVEESGGEGRVTVMVSR